MYARTTTVLAKRESIDAGIAHIRDAALPALQRMDGFIGLSLLVDRVSGRCVATSSWESKAAMRAPAGPVGTHRCRRLSHQRSPSAEYCPGPRSGPCPVL